MELLTFPRNIQLVRTMIASSLFVAVALVHSIASAEGAPVSAAPTAPKLLQTYTTKAGDMLDRVIQKTMADSPLKIELIRQAFVELNPQAFPSGRAGQMRKGMVLQIPDANKLLSSKLISSKLVSAPQDPAEVKKVSGHLSNSSEERRHWVRYP